MDYRDIALEYKKSIYVPTDLGPVIPENGIKVAGLLADIAQLGFTLDDKATLMAQSLNDKELKSLHKFLVAKLKKMVGANVTYTPLFRNFPQDIPNDLDYLKDRIAGFLQNEFNLPIDNYTVLSCGHAIDHSIFNLDDFGACPICQQQVKELSDDESNRPALSELTPLKIVSVTNKDEIYTVFSNLVSAKTSISEQEKEIIETFVKTAGNSIEKYLPDNIPMKENLALLSGLLLEHTDVADKVLSKYFNTATDVLRLATQLSGGDISLKQNVKFKLSNPNRRLIMSLLDKIKHPEPDMVKYLNRWIRLGEVLHIGTKKHKYPRAAKAFNTLRNAPNDIQTFNGKVESLVKDVQNGEDTDGLVEVLKSRPGEFARRLDFVLRNSNDPTKALTAFKGVIDKLTTPMLLGLSAHFKNRTKASDFRYYIPKGNLAKVRFEEGDLRTPIKKSVVTSLTGMIEDELINRFSKLDDLGSVYINPELANYTVPFSQRSATKALETISRGSKVNLDKECTNLRMFLYWKENKDVGRVDVDLTAVGYDKDFNHVSHLSYTNLSNLGGQHSGDIQSAPKGAAEFIDVDIAKFLAQGIRYVAMNVYSFTGQNFDTYECFAGVMDRKQPFQGKKFEAKTVKNKFDVAGNTTVNIPLIVDLETRQIIWADFSLTSRMAYNNIESNNTGVAAMCRVAESLSETKPTLFDLFSLHAKARAKRVDTVKDPDVEYDLVLDINKATDIDDIVANWL